MVNDELVRQASEILGTTGLKPTIDRALEEIIQLHARREAIDQLREMRGLDLDNDEVMQRAWR